MYIINMKKFLYLSLILIVVLSSCATTVRFNTLAPSEVNLGANQVIAVAPVAYEYRGRNSKYIPVKVDSSIPVPEEIKTIPSSNNFLYAFMFASKASDSVYSALSEGVYKIVGPDATEKYLDSATRFNSAASILKANGITLLFDSSLDGMDYSEYIEGKAFKNEKGESYYVYYLVQRASLSYSYRLLDLQSNKVADAKSYYGIFPDSIFEYEYRTKIAQKAVDGKVTTYTEFMPTSITIYDRIFSDFAEAIRDRLVPHVVSLRFSLLSERGNKEFEAINKLVNEGYLGIAYDQYMSAFQSTGSIVAGYNAAVLNYALGNQVEAISFVQDLYNKTLNADCGKLLEKMLVAYGSEQQAISQITK